MRSRLWQNNRCWWEILVSRISNDFYPSAKMSQRGRVAFKENSLQNHRLWFYFHTNGTYCWPALQNDWLLEHLCTLMLTPRKSSDFLCHLSYFSLRALLFCDLYAYSIGSDGFKGHVGMEWKDTANAMKVCTFLWLHVDMMQIQYWNQPNSHHFEFSGCNLQRQSH